MASLLHDDVIDNADTRRGLRALNTLFGNKVRAGGSGSGADASLSSRGPQAPATGWFGSMAGCTLCGKA